MIKANNLKATKVIELASDPAKGTEQATKFIIGALTPQQAFVLSSYMNVADADGGYTNNEAQMTFHAARMGLRGWENFNDEAGQPIKFKTDHSNAFGIEMASNDTINLLPIEAIVEIATAVGEFNTVSAAEEKNSA